jgi:ankyrin repeat protein
MLRLLTLKFIRDRVVYFLGMEHVPCIVLAHPSLYGPCLATSSISSSSWASERKQYHFLPSLGLARFPSLTQISLSGQVTNSPEICSFLADCASRSIAVRLESLNIVLPCCIPRDMPSLSVDALLPPCSSTYGFCANFSATCIFNGQILSTSNFSCRIPDWRTFAAANPALFESDTLPEGTVIDLSSADVSRSWVGVETATSLMEAVQRKQSPEIVTEFAKQWCHCVNRYNETALLRAAKTNNTELVAALIPFEAGSRLGNLARTALMVAAENGHPECVSLLIPHEAGFATSDYYFQSALMLAAAHGHVSCISLLAPVEAGYQDNRGQTALMLAAERCDVASVSLLVATEAGATDAAGNTALLRALHLQSTRNGVHQTPSQLGLRGARLAIVQLLLPTEAGIADPEGETPLMTAISHNVTDCIPLLVPAGASRADKEGKTALMRAAERGDFATVSLVIDKEARMVDNAGKTALMFAAEHGMLSCVSLLRSVEAGMSDVAKRTALMYAAILGADLCVNALLAEACMIDSDGKTALRHALDASCPHMVSLLPEDDHDHAACVQLLASKELNVVDENGKVVCEHDAVFRVKEHNSTATFSDESSGSSD